MQITIHDHAAYLDNERGLWVHFDIGEEPNFETFDFGDIIGAEFEAGHIDDYHEEGEGMVLICGFDDCFVDHRGQYVETRRGRLQYTFDEYLKELGGDELNKVLSDYIRSKLHEFMSEPAKAA